jgi:hypothetical protein
MAQVTITKVVEGESHLVVRLDMLSDGVSGELVNFPVLYPSGLLPARANNRPAFRIMQVWYGLVWFDITLKTAGIEPHTLWTLARDCDSHTDFRSFGGIIDSGVYENPPDNDTGILTMTTNGFSLAGSQGTVVLELRKTSAP